MKQIEEKKPFTECFQNISPTKKVKKRNYLDEGNVPVIDQGEEFIGGYTNDSSAIQNVELPVILFGDHTRRFKFVNSKFAVGADGVKILKVNSKLLDEKFVFYQLLQAKLPNKGYSRHYQYLKKVTFWVPKNKQIQTKTVDAIETQFTRLDAAIKSLKTIQTKLDLYRQSVLKAAFKGKLTEEWRNIHKGTKAGKEFLENIASIITKGSTPTTYGYKYLSNGISFIKVENIVDGRIDEASITQFIGKDAHEFQKRSQLKENDILFSIAGTIGASCVVAKENLPANTNQALAIIRGYSEYLMPKYLLWQLRSYVAIEVTIKARGGAMNNISLGDLRKLEIFVPSKKEQEKIIDEIESRFSVIDKIEETVNNALVKAERLRKSILKSAFEGKLVN